MSTHGEKSRELKFRLMELHLQGKVPIKVLAGKFGVPESTIFGWRKQYLRYGEDAFVGCGKQRPADAELRRLKKENERLLLENELLKKIAAYQAQLEGKKS